MATIEIIEVDAEQGIAEYGTRNIRQFDMRAYYGEHLIASLWQDGEENWYWTKRLYDIGTVTYLNTTYLEDKSVLGIINHFAMEVHDWLEDEISYLTALKIRIGDAEVGCE